MTTDPKLHYEHCLPQPHIADLVEFGVLAIKSTGLSFDEASISKRYYDVFGMMQSQSVILEAMARYQLAGQQAFIVGPGMRTAFQNTMLDGISHRDLRLPYDAFYICLPDCDWMIWGGPTEWHVVTGMYVARSPGSIDVAIWGPENEKSTSLGDDAQAWIRLDSLEGDASLEYVLTQVLGGGPVDSGLTVPLDDDNQQAAIVNAVRVAINLCLYLQSEAAQTTTTTPAQRRAPLEAELRRKKNPGKAKVIERRLAQLSTSTVTRIGGSYEQQLSSALRNRVNSDGTRQHIVRGHWHTYLTGRGRAVPIRKWVLPFVRGTQTPAYESRRYTIGEPAGV